MNIDLIKILNNFDSISLNQLGNAKLMDRTDTKFIFHYNELPSILNDLKLHYKCLEIDGVINSTYETLYFDTANNHQYIQHQNGKANRYKIRFRNYVESKLSYLEIKFKSNKERTIKTRIKSTLEDNLTEIQKKFIETNSNLNPELLMPKVWINYKRICLVNKTSNERLTLDTNLEIIFGNKSILLDNLVIAEVKREGKNPSPFIETVKKHSVREGGISKYCLGIALTNKNIKTNRFKEKLIKIKRIQNDARYTFNNL